MASQPSVSATLPQDEPYKTDIQLAEHHAVSDEPESTGGTNKGPEPVRMALGALAACTAMTVKMYINRKEWAVGDINVDVYYDISLAKKEETPEEERPFIVNGRIRRITKDVKIQGDFDDKQLKKIRIISGKCPVNLMLIQSCIITDKISTY